MNVRLLVFVSSVAAGVAGFAHAADRSIQRTPRSVATVPQPAAVGGPLRILLVDDDVSDNNHSPRDSRQSPSDRVFRKLVADTVGKGGGAWEVESVPPYGSGPTFERLRDFSLIVWYTGASYGGNPDNTAVLSQQDEKTVRRYLEETGGAVILVSPGYISKVLGNSWDKSDWPFASEVLGLRGGVGLAQRFLPGTVVAPGGGQFSVGKGGAVETQFSLVNPGRATVLFTTQPSAAKSSAQPAPVATVFGYGRGRIVYVGFTFENLATDDLAPAFRQLLAAAGVAQAGPAAAAPAPTPAPVYSAEAEPATVQVSGTPSTAVVSWTLKTQTLAEVTLGARQQHAARSGNSVVQPAPQTPTVRVERLVPNAASVRLTVASPDALSAEDRGPLTPGRAVTYRVTLTDSQGRSGAKEASFTPPMPRDPAGLTAATAADGKVTLSWQPVADAVGYEISGTALTAPVVVSYTTQWTSPAQAPGTQQWKVASRYAPSGVLTAASAWPSVTSHALPTPGRPFLSMPNGPGSIAESAAFYDKQCETSRTSTGTQCPDAAWFLSLSPDWQRTWDSKYGGGRVPAAWPSAAFADLHDLGLGRRVNCTAIANAPSRVTLCWATSHGTIPPAGQAPDAAALASAGEQSTAIKSMNIILISAQGAFFGTWEPARAITQTTDSAQTREDAFVEASGKRYVTVLDSQGPKSVPNACLSCHGGRYDPTRRIVVGASLLPLIPSHLHFSSPQARASAEEQVRRINYLVLESNPSPTIAAQITALYNGTPGTPGTPANDAAIPAGWASQPGLYRQVVAPYCGTCHFSQTGLLHFGTFANLQLNKQRVQQAVCANFTMPHSEQGFRRFWSEGGTVSLPGLLSTALGFPRCAP